MSSEFIVQIVELVITSVVTLIAGYSAIKADLVKAILTAETAGKEARAADKNAGECHARLDRHIEVKH